MQLIKQKKCQNDIVLRGLDGFADSYLPAVKTKIEQICRVPEEM